MSPGSGTPTEVRSVASVAARRVEGRDHRRIAAPPGPEQPEWPEWRGRPGAAAEAVATARRDLVPGETGVPETSSTRTRLCA
ncbi:hypothetical protein [Streptomyces sp. NPDC004726]